MSELSRYERYAAWCRILAIEPAAFHVWRRESLKIPDIRYGSHVVQIWDALSFATVVPR